MPFPAIGFPEPDTYLEATGDGVRKRVQRANRAAQDVLKERNEVERAAVLRLKLQLQALRQELGRRLLAGEGSLTDFRRFNLNAMVADVDRLVEDNQQQLAQDARAAYSKMGDIGDMAAEEPLRAAQLNIRPELPGLDSILVSAAFDNTLELLTQPMQQFASTTKVLLRGVALAGDQKFEAIQKLQAQIEGQGMDSAQYKAERIIRTELGRVFNQATYDRLVSLANDFGFLRKGWRAAGDTRTRIGHREAARTYARGSGIPMAERFQIKVYDERGKQAKLLGNAMLRFPLDPLVKPDGRVGAAATIMCRCNAFVDFDLADFASYSRNQIQLALGGVLPPIAPPPIAVPAPVSTADPKTLGAALKARAIAGIRPLTYRTTFFGARTTAEGMAKMLGSGVEVIPFVSRPGFYAVRNIATGQLFGPNGWTGAKARVSPRVPKPAPVIHPLKAGATEGPKVSAALVPSKGGALAKLHAKVMGMIDGVHSDGDLPRIPLMPSGGRFYGQYRYGTMTGGKEIKISSAGMKAHPMNTLAHEVGHWLDNMVVGRKEGFYAPGVPLPRRGQDATAFAGSSLMDQWKDAARNSPTIQRLKTWSNATTTGDGNVPQGVSKQHLRYLLSTNETWARSYAQYIAIRSEDPDAIAELRQLQKAASVGPVPATHRYNTRKLTNQDPDPNSWDYPTVWQDDEFEPIARAFDAIFEAMGWRKRSGR